MDQPTPSPPNPRPWILWGLSVLVMYGLATGLRHYIGESRVFFQEVGATNLPRYVKATLEFGPYLWIVVTAISLEGVRRILRNDRAAALTWCLGAVLAVVSVAAAMGGSLYLVEVGLFQTLNK